MCRFPRTWCVRDRAGRALQRSRAVCGPAAEAVVRERRVLQTEVLAGRGGEGDGRGQAAADRRSRVARAARRVPALRGRLLAVRAVPGAADPPDDARPRRVCAGCGCARGGQRPALTAVSPPSGKFSSALPDRQLYTDGTRCGAGGAARSTAVVAACAPQPAIMSVKEPKTCQYEVVVGLPTVCSASELRAAKQQAQQVAPREPWLLAVSEVSVRAGPVRARLAHRPAPPVAHFCHRVRAAARGRPAAQRLHQDDGCLLLAASAAAQRRRVVRRARGCGQVREGASRRPLAGSRTFARQVARQVPRPGQLSARGR